MGIYYRFPINSKESIQHCFEIGGRGSEMDIQLTKDSVLVIFHDTRLDKSSSCNGIVNDKTWDEIKDCYHDTPLSREVKIISLQNLLDEVDTKDFTLVLDCKTYIGSSMGYDYYLNTYTNALKKIIDENQLKNRVFIESGDTNFLRILKIKDPQLKLFINPRTFDSGLEFADRVDLFGITIHHEKISKEEVSLSHQHNRRVAVWSVGTENENLEAIKKSVDYIQSDRLKHLLKIFGEYKN